MKLKNKIIIITGAGGGIGGVIVKKAIEEGAKVIAIDNKDSKNSSSGSLLWLRADISSEKDAKTIVKKTLKEFGKIDALVNAAGIQGPIGPFHKNIIKDWQKNIEVNFLGTAIMCHAVLPSMIKNGSGSIINFSGGGATSPRVNFSAYAASKTAVVRFTETLAGELKQYKININAVAPGAVNTNMTQELIRNNKKAGKEELVAAKKRLIQGGTPPELVAELVLYLASEKSHNLTGKLISAPWDDWKKWSKKDVTQINKSARYTLRRIDNKYFKTIKT